MEAQLVSPHEALTAGVMSLSLEQTSPPPVDSSEPDAVLSRGWIVAFRALHEQAQAGDLNALEAARYDRERAALSSALLDAQRLTLKPGTCVRRSLRLAASAECLEIGSAGATGLKQTLDPALAILAGFHA